MSDFYYPVYNAYNSAVSPSTVHVKNTGLARFFKRYLLQEAISVFEWRMPETWDRSYFLYVLYVWGFISVLNTDHYGVVPQHCELGGYNVFYAPAYAIITNPLFDRTYRLKIGDDCEVLRLDTDFHGLYDLIDYYGDLMALAAEAAGVNLLNSKLSFVMAAKNKTMAESLKKVYDDYSSGEPAIVLDTNLLDENGKLTVEMFNQDVGGNFIVDRLLDVMRSIRCMFLTDIGIPNTNLFKASGIGASEIAANNIETRSKCALWLDELKRGIKRVNAMFPGIDLSVDWRKDLKDVMEGMDDERLDLNTGTI